jgi:hypothetical protein
MTTEDAIALLKRMQLAYDPPRALRGYPDAIKERLRIYRHALERFDSDILDRAWLKAAASHHFEQWPDCPEIVKAAEGFHALAHPKAKVDDGWVERVTVREDEYTKRFMATTQAAVRAREGGYEAELKRYVLAAAHVQAQFLEGRQRPGYDFYALFGKGDRDKKAEDEWFARQKEQADSGSIRVRVPLALVERWRNEAEKGWVR